MDTERALRYLDIEFRGRPPVRGVSRPPIDILVSKSEPWSGRNVMRANAGSSIVKRNRIAE